MHKFVNIAHYLFMALAVMILSGGTVACNRSASGEESHDTGSHAGHGHEADAHEDADDHNAGEHNAGESAHAEDGHEGHGHEGPGDLEKTAEQLFAEACEHGIKTYACDECRYEVGVVKVPHDLIEQGLVKVEKVRTHNFNSGIALTGEVRFDERKIVHLSPRVAGVVSRVAVDLGDSVTAGQVLVELESVDLAEAQADYLEALAEKRLAQKTLKRQQSLHEQNITSEREYLEAQQIYESAGIRTNSAHQKLLRLGVSDGAIALLEKQGQSSATGKLLVRAPFSGEVLELHAVLGERIEPGAEMLLVGDTSALWVWVDLYETQLADVKKAMTDDGLQVRLNVRAYPDEWLPGRMDVVGKVMDEQTRTVKARVVLDNSEGKLKPGMFATVQLELDVSAGRLAVTDTAVLSDDGRAFVFVHQDGDYFLRRAVTPGRKAGGYVEILDGLTADQTIAVAGAFLLKSDVLRSKMGEGCAH
jgi:cobalt-zinc-cadmium efflux system membrane fusion protein